MANIYNVDDYRTQAENILEYILLAIVIEYANFVFDTICATFPAKVMRQIVLFIADRQDSSP